MHLHRILHTCEDFLSSFAVVIILDFFFFYFICDSFSWVWSYNVGNGVKTHQDIRICSFIDNLTTSSSLIHRERISIGKQLYRKLIVIHIHFNPFALNFECIVNSILFSIVSGTILDLHGPEWKNVHSTHTMWIRCHHPFHRDLSFPNIQWTISSSWSVSRRSF